MNGISVVVHAPTTSQAVSKGAVVRSLHGVSPAQRTANSHLLSLLPSKRWLAFDRFACNTIASLNFLSGLWCVDWILTGSNHQMMLVCCGGGCVFTGSTLSNETHTSSQHNVCTCTATHQLQNDTNTKTHNAPHETTWRNDKMCNTHTRQ